MMEREELQQLNQSESTISNQFSNEIFFKIFSGLPVKDVLSCRLVCRTWRDNQAILLILRTRTKPINFRCNTDIKYFSWLMRTTPGFQIPFSKVAIHFNQNIAANTVEDFLSRGLDVTGLAINFYIQKRVTYKISKWTEQKHSRYTPVTDYRQSVSTLLHSAIKLTSLYLTVPLQFEFPVLDDSSYVQTFQYLKKFKVKFALMDSGLPLQSSEHPTIFESIIKNSPRLQVLSLLYYPYFCAVQHDNPASPGKYPSNEVTMRTPELQRLPIFLGLLRSSSTKVKLRLGIITNTFQYAFIQLRNLDPQPRIVALAISLPPEVHFGLRTAIWRWIQTLPLLKLKFFENYRRHMLDIPVVPTKPFYSLHQLRLTHLTQLTLERDSLLFPNIKKLTIHSVSEENTNGPSMSPDFEAFRSLVANIPHLEHLRLKEDAWEVLTAEPFRDIRESHNATENYVIQQIENQRGKNCEIFSPIKQLKQLKTLQVDWDFVSLCAAAYASETGRLQRLSRFIFMTKEELPDDPYYVNSVAAAILRNCHDHMEFPNKYIKD